MPWSFRLQNFYISYKCSNADNDDVFLGETSYNDIAKLIGGLDLRKERGDHYRLFSDSDCDSLEIGQCRLG